MSVSIENPYKFLATTAVVLFTSSIVYTDNTELELYKKKMDWRVESIEIGAELRKQFPDADKLCASKGAPEIIKAVKTQESKLEYLGQLESSIQRTRLIRWWVSASSIGMFVLAIYLWIVERMASPKR